jgi:uncharacterized membrane protein YphA (DoxX/SURF4 family)
MHKFTFSVIESIQYSLPLFIKQFFSPKRYLFSIWPYRLLRLALAVIFIWSGSAKLIDPLSFAILIDSYGLTPETWTPFISYALPFLEVVAGIGLLFDLKGTLAIITTLLIIFMFILGYGIHMGLDVDCGCFGPEDPEAKAYHGLRPALYRDILMFIVIVYLYAWRFRNRHNLLHFKNLLCLKQRR